MTTSRPTDLFGKPTPKEQERDREFGAMAGRWPQLDDEFFAPLDVADLAKWDAKRCCSVPFPSR